MFYVPKIWNWRIGRKSAERAIFDGLESWDRKQSAGVVHIQSDLIEKEKT